MYGTIDPFAAIDAVTTPTGEGGGDDFKPAPGQYRTVISGTAFDTSKKGELYLRVEFKLDSGDSWSDVRVLTKDGVPQEGRIKAAKVMLRTLGLNGDLPAASWKQQLGSITGRAFFVDVIQNGDFLNTNVIGPDQVAPAPAAAAPAAAGFGSPAVVAAPVQQGVPLAGHVQGIPPGAVAPPAPTPDSEVPF